MFSGEKGTAVDCLRQSHISLSSKFSIAKKVKTVSAFLCLFCLNTYTSWNLFSAVSVMIDCKITCCCATQRWTSYFFFRCDARTKIIRNSADSLLAMKHKKCGGSNQNTFLG